MPVTPLAPVDRKQCQAEKPNPDYGPFRLGGSTQKRIRCTNKPVTIATEIEPSPIDGQRGKMSLCADCEAVCKMQMPGHATYRPLRTVSPAKLQQAITR